MLISRSSYIFPLFAFASLVYGQSESRDKPPKTNHFDDPIVLEHAVVSATPLQRNQTAIASPTSVLSGRALAQKLQPSLGETLAGKPGIASTYFGPGASRPVIRALGGDRIRVLENSVGTIDASTASPDHAVSLDPLLIERVEVVRGPAALMFGSNAVGGVVNVIDRRIPQDLPENVLTGEATVRAGSVDQSRSGAVILEGAVGNFAWHLDGYRRQADDVEIPGFAETQARRVEALEHAAEEGEPAPSFIPGRIANTSLRSDGAGVGLSWIRQNTTIGISATGHNANYGVPPSAHEHGEHEDEEHADEAEEEAEEHNVRIDLRQRRADLHASTRPTGGLVQEVRLKAGFAEYSHREIEGDAISTVFKNRGYDGRIEVLHQPLGRWAGALGAQLSHNDLAASGAEAFLPPSHTARVAIFVFEEASFDPVTYQLGARVESQEIELRDGSGIGRDGQGTSLSVGTIWNVDAAWSLSASAARSERQPNAQELFSNGAHVGTRAFEIGDPGLGRETSLALDLSLRRHVGFVTGELTVFANRFDGYIFEQPTGEEREGLNEYRYVQRDAEFYGIELEAVFHLKHTTTHTLDLHVGGDMVRGRLRDTRDSLPRITPRRLTVGLEYRRSAISAGINVQAVERARRLAPGEMPTSGYLLFGADFAWRIPMGRQNAEIFLRGANLTNEEARNHVSFLKDVAPLPGRDVSAGLRLSF